MSTREPAVHANGRSILSCASHPYVVMSHLYSLLFQPRHKEKEGHAVMRYDIALHLEGLRNVEAELIVTQTAKLLQCSRWTKPYNKTVVSKAARMGRHVC